MKRFGVVRIDFDSLFQLLDAALDVGNGKVLDCQVVACGDGQPQPWRQMGFQAAVLCQQVLILTSSRRFDLMFLFIRLAPANIQAHSYYLR
jgi:hypothetical protein